ncbi:MAG: NDP-sugar synthase [Acidobacteria bacterium]|nr:NDP-sugar synthase [Acidobacteriota bacterium]
MKAMVLAAGYGERMKPLTWNRAKPALPLLNRPSVLHLLEHLARSGISQVILNLHYRPDTIRALEPRIKELGLRVGFSEEAVILGTGGGLKNAEAFLTDGTFLMVNSDFVTDCPILLALEYHRQSQALATLILTPYREGTEYGAVEMDEDGSIVRIAGRPGPDSGKPRYHFTGIHILEQRIFKEIPSGVKSEINHEVYPRLIQGGARISGYVHDGFWRELGTPQRYLDGSLDLLARGDSGFLQRTRVREGLFSATPLSELQGAPGAAFLAGAGLKMEEGTSAAGVVLGDRVHLSRGASLTRSVLWDDVVIGEQSSLDECIIGHGARVPPHSRLHRKIVLDTESYGGDLKGLESRAGLLLTSF